MPMTKNRNGSVVRYFLLYSYDLANMTIFWWDFSFCLIVNLLVFNEQNKYIFGFNVKDFNFIFLDFKINKNILKVITVIMKYVLAKDSFYYPFTAFH